MSMKLNENKITVKVLFFGDAAGAEEAEISTSAPATVGGVKDLVFSRYARLATFSKSLMIAVNQAYSTDLTMIKDQDEIAFLPPVSGG